MAYTTAHNFLTLKFRDVRNVLRNRTIELGGLVVVTDDDATEWDTVSKSIVRGYYNKNQQIDNALVAAADSEVKDTARLYFLLPDDTTGHLDIVDPVDDLFLSTTGPGANIIIEYADMAGGSPSQVALQTIIDKVLSGSILIDDGETPTTYLYGERI